MQRKFSPILSESVSKCQTFDISGDKDAYMYNMNRPNTGETERGLGGALFRVTGQRRLLNWMACPHSVG